MEYNTCRPSLILKEYGRNVQKLIEFLDTIEDKTKRTAYAYTLIELMKQVTPSHKDNQSDNAQKLWDDLYIMSDYTVDLKSPFPMPEREIQDKKPKKVPYQKPQIRYRYYGKNIELLIEKVMAVTDEKDREDAIVYIGRLMKSFYNSWNNDFVEDRILVKQINALSDGELEIDAGKVQSENLFEPLFKERKQQSSAGYSRQAGGHRSGGKTNNNRHNQNRRRSN